MRTLREIANEIEADWKVINNALARAAITHMKCMGAITADPPDGYEVVGAFLGSSVGWKGDIARRIKKELRQMCGHPRP